ncbi:transporter substrate-binding domain-containing protein [Sporosarcina sp. UB5]|uniref:transporter substrate-binding domain-containing protein n=1 Tax=Sporosarcina sp. UB5 TaxID=3047463 RepID=UPI003D794713
MFKLHKSLLLLIIATLMFVLTACGTAGESQGDKVLSSIGKEKVLRVGTDATFKPFEYKSGGEFQGYDIDLIKAIAKELGADKVEFVDTEFKGLIPGLQAKKFDLIVSAMYITDERKKTIDFSDSYFPGGLSIMVQEDNNAITTLEDLSGKDVAVQIGTKAVEFLEENVPEANLVKVEKNTEMFLELETGKVDAVVTGLPAAKVYVKENGKMKVLEETLTEEHYGYGIRKENAEFREAVNKALQTLKDNGTYDEITSKWFD